MHKVSIQARAGSRSQATGLETQYGCTTLKGKTRERSEATVRKPRNYNAKQSVGRGTRHKKNQRQIKQLECDYSFDTQDKEAAKFSWLCLSGAQGSAKAGKEGPGRSLELEQAGNFFLLSSTGSNIRLKHFSLHIAIIKQLF